ncbi:RES family NAD+ phosphorylase [Vibrio gazogenes]|nr:RES family NAD+ phosphorylase [Vibrio gazogenes]USP13542.1 RES family NAD+ phosphorylase [Vibrio gazogenes]
MFEFLTYVLEEDENGDYAYKIIDDTFQLFNNDITNKQALFEEVTKESFNGKKYKLAISFDHYKESWKELCEELKHSNRFFPTGVIYSKIFKQSNDKDLPVFSSILEQLESTAYITDCFYRARISDEPLTANDMGAPPQDKTSAGRANPKGIAYMYLADNIDTCVSEVRPYNGAEIYVSEFKLKQTKTLIDLTDPRKKFSIIPFQESDYGESLAIIELLEAFALALSIPVKPHLSELDYIPTQFLCEYFKSLGPYDGIIFNSSFSKGKNYVFFNTDEFNIDEPAPFRLNSINFEYS